LKTNCVRVAPRPTQVLVTAWVLVGLAWPRLACAEDAAPASAPVKGAGTEVQGIVVTAQRPKSQVLIDRKVYVVSGNLQATTGSAADVLNEVPSVDVDPDGVLTLRGDSNVTILVDGKPSAAFSGAAAGLSLLQFPASEIDRIEVMPNPPAQYKAEGSAGVINIITKKSRQAGLSGSARLSVGESGRFVLGGDVAYNTGKLKLTGGVGLRQDIRERRTTDNRTEQAPAPALPTQSAESIDERFHRLTPSLKAGADYALSARQSLGGSVNFTDLTGHRYFDQFDLSGPPGAPVQNDSLRASDGHERHIEESAEGHLSQELWRPDETLNVSLQQSATHEHERYTYANSAILPPGPPTADDLHLGLDLVKTEFSADYDLPLPGKADVKLGYDLESDDDSFGNLGDTIDPTTGVRTVDPTITNQFRYRQTVNALYGAYDKSFDQWSVQAGLRAEAARANWLQVTGDVPGGRSEFALYPSLQAERAFGEDDKVSISLSRRVTRPDPEALNPFIDHQDIYNLRAGNPNLLPQDTWSVQLAYAHSAGSLSYGLTPYYRIDRDSVTDVAQSEGGGVVLLTKANLPKSQSAGSEFNLSGKLTHSLSYTLSGNAFYTQIDATALGAPGLRSTVGVNLKGSVEYRPTSHDTFQVSLSRTDRRLTPQGSVDAIDLVNIGYRRQVRPDLAIVVTASDVLDGQRFRRFETTPTLTDAYQRYQFGQIAYVGVVYTFGGSAKPKPASFDYAD
jgi:outer membrane receptor protein involved in Fe transport